MLTVDFVSVFAQNMRESKENCGCSEELEGRSAVLGPMCRTAHSDVIPVFFG